MQRTTITLPDELGLALKREARRRHTSVSAVVREAVSERLGFGAGGRREVSYAALGRSDAHLSARNADEALAEVFEARAARRSDARSGR